MASESEQQVKSSGRDEQLYIGQSWGLGREGQLPSVYGGFRFCIVKSFSHTEIQKELDTYNCVT